jgi:hypothetical protein
MWVARVIAPAPHTVMLLGDIREAQKMREGPCDSERSVDRHVTKQLGELVEAPVLTGVRPFREPADVLDQLEEFHALVLAQHVAEQLPEQTHVVTQRFVRVSWHGDDYRL